MSGNAWTICPAAGALNAALNVPGDKSISHRAAMLSALATGTTRIDGFLDSEDCLNTLKAVTALGAETQRDGTTVTIRGTAGRFLSPSGVLDLGNSGTGMRLLAGLLAGQPLMCTMTGDASLCSRPMGRIRDPLVTMGARVEALGGNGCAPLRVEGGTLRAIRYPLPMASAQVKSAVLLAGMTADGTTTVIEPAPTRDHTERMLAAMGAPILVDGLTVTLVGTRGAPVVLKAQDWQVPGDFSSAAFWLTAAACIPGSQVTIRGVGINPRRTALCDVLERMGADIEPGPVTNTHWEPQADITVRGGELTCTEVGGVEIPNLIDELPLVAVAAACASGTTQIRDAAELRVKESDRIACVAEGLRHFGVDVAEQEDGMDIAGGTAIAGDAVIESHGDHRIAMAMAILGLRAGGPTTIRNVACVDTSYPGFRDDLRRVTGDQ